MSLTPLVYLILYVYGWIAALSVGSWAFLTYQMVYFSNPANRWWGYSLPSFSWSFATVVLMLGSVYILHKERSSTNHLFAVPQTKWVMAMLALNVALSPIAVSPEDHSRILNEFLKLGVILALAFKLVDSKKRIVASLWMYLVGCAYIGWEAYSIGRNSQGRVEGIGPVDSPDANGTAAVLVPAIPLMLAWFCTGSLRTRIGIVLLGGFIVNGLILINSRGAFIATLGSTLLVLILLLFSSMQRGSQRIIAVLAVCVALVGAYSLTDDAFWERMSTVKSEDEGASGSHRVHLWMATFDMVGDYPFGTGATGFTALSQYYVDPEKLDIKGKNKAVHSTWFQTLAETGWVGLALFLALIVSCFKCTRAARSHALAKDDSDAYWVIVAVEAGLLGYLLASSFIDRYRAEILYWMVLYSACLYNVHCLKDTKTTTPKDSPEADDKRLKDQTASRLAFNRRT